MDASTTSTSLHEHLKRHVDSGGARRRGPEERRRHPRQRHRPLPVAPAARPRSGDVALFQFCGHGAQWASNAAFREAFPDGKDEGLVCSDSRRPGGYDLADKELAVLIAEVAANDAHVAVLFDCCHSGSGTREVKARRGLKPRLTHEVTTERPLESYLDGHYSRLRDARAAAVRADGPSHPAGGVRTRSTGAGSAWTRPVHQHAGRRARDVRR